jgi:tight adherence protein C
MVWTITLVTFLATVSIVGALLYAFMPGELGIAERLSRLWGFSTPVQETGFAQKQKERARDGLASVGQMVGTTPLPGSRASLLMIRAGYRSTQATLAVRGVQMLLPVGLVALAFFTRLYLWNPILVFALAVLVGYLAPEAWLIWRVHARQHRMQLALPDVLDLLVICVEAGLGLDQALLRVAQELRISHPELSNELNLVNLEMRVGKTRIDALRELARRTGLEDIKALVAMLIQTERFGTSVAQSLRVHSDDLRVKRRQRAEEMSAKTTVKMVPPLVFFIFPALMVVILGPAVLTLMRQLIPALK